MIQSLLVANRGEIALRVFRSCREVGIRTVAVYSDADAGAPHAGAADAAVRLAGDAPGETYLRGERVIEAALAAGADAVHPGYGFLSENADFARAVVAAGLTWVGPRPSAIATMGAKAEAKRLMTASGVPVLAELEPSGITTADVPVLVKASAGGGGRGMRAVRELADLESAVREASDEAAGAFGDGTVFCERYLDTGRHIEVQLLADEHGTVIVLGERECSIQRRHQKVVEEAPSPLVDADMRENLFEAARNAAKAVDYVGAGTVEFLATGTGEFYFLEMNTRLQVEHPVTECTTGVDIVAEQLRIAEGGHLGDDPGAATGHAIEVRLYAETVTTTEGQAGWQPRSGMLHRFHFPGVATAFEIPTRYGVRLDSGVTDGSTVSVHYDPMLAKVIAWAPDRAGAARVLATTLADARIHGVATNRELLVNVLRHRAFLAGDTDTSFFDRHGLESLARPLADETAKRVSALVAALGHAAANRADARVLANLPSGWRNVYGTRQRKSYRIDDSEYEVYYRIGKSGLDAPGYETVELLESTPDLVVLRIDGVCREFRVGIYSDITTVDSPLGPVELVACPRFTDPEDAMPAGSLTAPMPGAVLRVAAEPGQRVEAGEPLLWLEAMKMEHRIAAPATGTVTELPVGPGDQVELGAILAVVTADE